MRTQKMLLAAALAMSALATSANAQSNASPALSSHASIDTSAALGRCPATMQFTGTITATNWSPTALRQVQYKWIRSDGADSATQTLNFGPGSPATQTVSTTWTLGASYSGYEAIQIVYPQNATSDRAGFALTCNSDGSASLGGASNGGGNPGASPEDCIGYDNQTLSLVNTGQYWRLQDGSMYMQIFQTQADAERGLVVAKNHSKQCFVGRNNTEPNRDEFIMEYWK